MRPITVLSLFDGISCGQQALKELGIPVKAYYASEIHLPSIKITQKNFPRTIQLGDITKIRWLKHFPKVDLLLAGSPCQGFSNQGKRLNFTDPRSKLFFEFIRLLQECKKQNSKVTFLLENVGMKKEWKNVITKYTKTQPLEIDSRLLSAQTRKRLYWTNIQNIKKPIDTKVSVLSILDQPFSLEHYGNLATDKKWKYNFNGGLTILNINKKAPCILTSSGSTYPLITVAFKKYRPFNINELERLQTLPDNYTEGISLAKRVNAIGNGWTITVIKHILKQLYK